MWQHKIVYFACLYIYDYAFLVQTKLQLMYQFNVKVGPVTLIQYVMLIVKLQSTLYVRSWQVRSQEAKDECSGSGLNFKLN